MTSNELFDRARKVMPGGVNSPVRAFNAVGGEPIHVRRGQGSAVVTTDGRELVDFCGSWGPLILGHAHPEVVEAVVAAARDGATFGISTPREVEFAELLCERIPSLEQVRLVSSGTEAVMTAVRLARGYTGRRRIVKFDGGYHGHSDGLLVGAGSGLLTGGIAASEGVAIPAGEVFLPQYNDKDAVSDIIDRHGDEIAAIVVEPVAGNMGLVLPRDGFLEHLRAEADRCGALLLFDEVITGFRFAPTTYGTLAGVAPDLTCLGKIVGGGMPLAAVGGRRQVMQCLAPVGPVYQAGTLSGNPVAVAAGMKTLEVLIRDDPYPALAARGSALAEALNGHAAANGLALHVAHLGGAFTVFHRREPVHRLADAKQCDAGAYAAFFNHMLQNGFYLPPSQFETAFISAAHGSAEIQGFVDVFKKARGTNDR